MGSGMHSDTKFASEGEMFVISLPWKRGSRMLFQLASFCERTSRNSVTGTFCHKTIPGCNWV